MQLAPFVILTVLLVPAMAAPSDAVAQRLVVSLEHVEHDQWVAAIAQSHSVVLRTDERLGMAVVESRHAGLLRGVLGDAVSSDHRAYVGSTPDDPHYQGQWALEDLGMPAAWRLERGQSSVLVGVVDSGVQSDHPDLDVTRIVVGKDYVDGDNWPQDEAGHGTHIAGIIAAGHSNGIGIVGMANVSLHVTRVFDARGEGWCSDVASAILDAAEAGAQVINFSGWCGRDLEILRTAARHASEAGSLLVSIVGNFQDHVDPAAEPSHQGPVRCHSVYPGGYHEVLAVAAYGRAFGERVPAPYSCATIHAELAAPGSGVLSTWIGSDYAVQSGTSMAAAHVSATAALVLSANPGLSASELRRVLMTTAQDMGTPAWNPLYGYGAVAPEAALARALE